jgi:hypothetical protein
LVNGGGPSRVDEIVASNAGGVGGPQYSAGHESVLLVGEARRRGRRVKSAKREKCIVKE